VLIAALVAVELLFVGMNLAPFWIESLPRFALFDLDHEQSIATWFSSSQLLLVGVFVWLSGLFPTPASKPSQTFFVTTGACFIYLSMDEAAYIHERITAYFAEYPWVPHFSGNHGVWIFVYASLFSVILFLFRHDVKAALRFYPNSSAILLSGFLVFVVGGVGVEIILYEMIHDDTPDLLRVAQYTAEEFLEMLGGSIMLHGAITLLRAVSACSAASSLRERK
jgi:hypothetical protein